MESSWYQNQVCSKNDIVDFNSFDIAFHDQPDQLKRRINAKKIKADKIAKLNNHYEIIGSSGDIYETTLSSCTCFDFRGRGLPCKHIYRVALEMDMIEDLPKVDSKASKTFTDSMQSEIEHFYSLYKQRAISAEKYIKIADAIQKGK